MKKCYLIACSLLLNVLPTSPIYAQDYDLAINGGRVMDPETLFDSVANVTPKRYIDWTITTPTMLTTLIFYLIYLYFWVRTIYYLYNLFLALACRTITLITPITTVAPTTPTTIVHYSKITISHIH